MKKIIFLLCFIVLICFILFTPYKLVFSFEETRTTNGQVFYIPLHKQEPNFQFIYTHSIHLSDVVEYYEVMNNHTVKSIAMEYEDLAIGMPGNAEEGQTFKVVDGKYRLEFDSNSFKSFTLHISNITSKQHFLYGDTEYDLKNVLKKGSSYLFSVKKVSILEWWKGGFAKND